MMNEKPIYPRRPIRAAAIAFVVLLLLLAASAPFVEPVRRAWPLAIAYAAALSVGAVGLVRQGRQLLPRIHALAYCVVGVTLLIALADLRWPALGPWLGPCRKAVPYVMCALIAWVCYLALRGWMLYFQPQDKEE